MDSDTWATVPCDLLIDIFRRLRSTAIIRCAAVCRPWRRAVIDNARCLRPRPDRFLPDLLIGFVHGKGKACRYTRLQDAPCTENVLALESVVDLGFCDTPLASRDGFILLRIWGSENTYFCLCNLMAGSCRFLPSATVSERCWQRSYVLTTASDDDSHVPDADRAGGTPVRVFAVVGEGNRVAYQILSSTSGEWGPVKRSSNLSDDNARVLVYNQPNKHDVVCSGCVIYWLVALSDAGACTYSRMCLFAMDAGTERTWTTGLPKERDDPQMMILATSDDGRRISLITTQLLKVHDHIEVWVLDGDSRWTLQRKIDIQSSIFPNWRCLGYIWPSGFCPRSGCMFGSALATDHSGLNQEFLIGVDGSLPRLIKTAGHFFPYETADWSTYISKMKYF